MKRFVAILAVALCAVSVISAVELRAKEEEKEEAIFTGLVALAWTCYKWYGRVKTVTDKVSEMDDNDRRLGSLRDTAQIMAQGITLTHNYCAGTKKLEGIGLKEKLDKNVCKVATGTTFKKCRCETILSSWETKLEAIKTEMNKIDNQWLTTEAFYSKENTAALSFLQTELTNMVSTVEQTRSMLFYKESKKTLLKFQRQVYFEMKRRMKETEMYKEEMYTHFKKLGKTLRGEEFARKAAISQVQHDVKVLQERMLQLEAEARRNKNNLRKQKLKIDETKRIEGADAFWKNVEHSMCGDSMEVHPEQINKWEVTQKVEVQYADLENSEKILTKRQQETMLSAQVKFQWDKDGNEGLKQLIVTQENGKDVITLSNADILYIKMYAPHGLNTEKVYVKDAKTKQVAFNADTATDDAAKDILYVDMIRDFSGLHQGTDDNSFFGGSKTSFKYRTDKCIVDEEKECIPFYCASIKLKSGKRHLVCLEKEPDVLEYLMLSFANKQSFRKYCKKCLKQHNLGQMCDTFQCSSSVYQTAYGNKKLTNDCKSLDFYE